MRHRVPMHGVEEAEAGEVAGVARGAVVVGAGRRHNQRVKSGNGLVGVVKTKGLALRTKAQRGGPMLIAQARACSAGGGLAGKAGDCFAAGGLIAHWFGNVSIAQWIEQRFPKPLIRVRFSVGAPAREIFRRNFFGGGSSGVGCGGCLFRPGARQARVSG